MRSGRGSVTISAMTTSTNEAGARGEWLAVAALTAIGFGLRLWPIGGLGLTHFDEGIYALVASWSLRPEGLARLDPVLISYAPPGYPILGGLAYAVLGRSDGAMIGVSQLAGTLTIPVVAWLARRSFGPGCGAAAAAFCAFSGPHIAFSRMALVDASALLAWLVALGLGMRFLERPGFGRALLMGFGVGLAQEFKYNGWLTGGIVVASAVLGVLVEPGSRRFGSLARVFGWGALAAVVAWLVVWPWYAFVERHGGYAALLRHQRNYLGGFGDWGRHLMIQERQAVALSGGPTLALLAVGFATLSLVVAPGSTWTLATAGISGRWRLAIALVSGLVAWSFLGIPSLLGLIVLPWMLGLPGHRFVDLLGPSGLAARLVGVCWLVLAILTPFYHPYARLWLPLQATHWLLLGWLVGSGTPSVASRCRTWIETGPRSRRMALSRAFWCLVATLGLAIGLPWSTRGILEADARPGLFAPSDSLYRATVAVAGRLPEGVRGLRTLVRPPVAFYLGGRIATAPMAGSDSLRFGGEPGVWALVDSAILRSEAGPGFEGSGRKFLERVAKGWEVVEEFPTTPGLPTWLDLDPDASRSTSGATPSYPLWLLRPRTAKGLP